MNRNMPPNMPPVHQRFNFFNVFNIWWRESQLRLEPELKRPLGSWVWIVHHLLLLTLAGTVMASTETTPITPAAKAAIVQDIEYLRRQYARATDQLGRADDSSQAEGRATYHQIFTPDAMIRTAGGDNEPFVARGPDGWADVVIGALASYATTQHLIGTQLVEIHSVEVDSAGHATGGDAVMTSYLQAWHATADKEVWIFIGTYHDTVTYVPGHGWQISEMTLEQTSEDYRALGSPNP